MRSCRLADNAADAFVECLRSDRGPAELHYCDIESHVLASALAGDSRVTRFEPTSVRNDDADMAILATALANNRGLVELNLQRHPIIDDNWTVLCESLKAHPSLTSLNLRSTAPLSPAGSGRRTVLTDDQKTHRTRLLAEMLKENTVLHTIAQLEKEWDQEIYTEEIHPHLETNLYRPRVLSVKKTNERPFREKVLGWALDSVKSSPNLVWMFLSENVDAFVRLEEESSTSIEVLVALPVVVQVALPVSAADIGSKRKRKL
jgi:hypothetical protein